MPFIIILAIIGCFAYFSVGEEGAPDRNKYKYEVGCNRNWKDSGYSHRLVESGRAYVNSNELTYQCQVNVNGRWIPEDNVKVG